MNNLLSRLKNLSILIKMQISTFPQQELVIQYVESVIGWVISGISSTPSLRGQKGSKPVIQSRNILKTYHPEQKDRTVGEVYRIASLGLSLKAPQIVEQYRLCLRTNLSNYLIAVSVGVFSQILRSESGNCVNRLSKSGILFLQVLTLPPPQLCISACKDGISAQSTSLICLSCPVVLLRLIS